MSVHSFSAPLVAGYRRRSGRILFLVLAVLLMGLLLAPSQAAVAAPAEAQTTWTCQFYHTVRVGETLASIGRLYNVTWTTLSAANNLPNPNRIYSGQVLCIPAAGAPPPPPPPSCQFWHTVQPGETLARIGVRYGISWSAIATANNLSNANRIYAGQQLCIPPGGIQPPPPATATGSVVAYYLNVRYGPGVGYGVATWLVRGQTVTVTHRNAAATWVRVQLPNGVQGWVNASWLALSTPIGNLPVANT